MRNIFGLNDRAVVSVHITLKIETCEGSGVVLFLTLTSLYFDPIMK